MLEEIEFKEGLEGISPTTVATLYRRAPLLREYKTPEELWEAYQASSLVLTAWYQGRLVGVARVLTDGVMFTFVCDLAVEPDVQREGIGRGLIDHLVERCGGTDIILRDSAGSSAYYPHVGFQKVGNAWVRKA